MAGTLRGRVHLPDSEFVNGDVFECRLLLLLDCYLQVTDSFRRENVNRKGVSTVKAVNPAVERE